MKPHYFNTPAEASGDMLLNMAKGQGYIPRTCLLGGQVVMSLVNKGEDPCSGCEGPRELCKGRPKKEAIE